MKVAFFGNTYAADNLSLLHALTQMLRQRRATVYFEAAFYHFVQQHLPNPPAADALLTDDNFTADMAVSIGGDGTFLHTAAHVGNKNIPIVGINTGRLGFLTDISLSSVVESFERILNGDCIVEERSLLHLDCCLNGEAMPYPNALNEVAVLKQDSSSMISIHTYINERHLVSYRADGLIVATPTGSTAYSMSIGGPLLVPEAQAIVLTPVASHSLTVRPLVMTDDCRIRLQVSSRTKSFLVAVDGRSQVCTDEIELNIRKADYSIKIIKQPEHDYIHTLKTKLMWGADTRSC